MAKKYNTRHKLTWFAPANCWKKFRNGKVYYLGKGLCKGKGDLEGYHAALREWVRLLPDIVDASESHDEPLYTDPKILAGASNVYATNYSALGKVAKPSAHNVCDLPRDIAGLVAAFLAECRTMAEAGQFTLANYNDIYHRLNDFVGYCNHVEATGLESLNNSLLASYRNTQIKLTTLPKDQGGISDASARKRLQFLARFVNWLAEREAIEAIPKIINRKFAAVKIAPPSPKFYTVEQVTTLVGDASPLLRACIMLALNTGATQVDVATLEHSHISKSGDLSRPRNKTGIDSAYVLWPETIAALREVQTKPKDSKLVLLSESGKPLVRESFKDDGRVVKVDSINSMFKNLLKRTGMDGLGLAFKHFRKTSANLLAQKYPPHVTDKFLAHISNGMRKHYAKEHMTDEYREALEYLRTAYNLNGGEK